MKIYVVGQFTPIHIVLESPKEVATLKSLLNMGFDDTLRGYTEHFNLDLKDIGSFKQTLQNRLQELSNDC